MKQPNHPTSVQLYGRLLQYVKPYWKAFVVAVICMVGTAATEPIFPAIMKQLLDDGFQANAPHMVWAIPVGIISLFVVRSIFVYISGYLMVWTSSHVVADLRRAMFIKLLALPPAYVQSQSAGHTISRLVYDVSHISDAATNALVSIIRELFTAIALIGYLLYLDWKLTLITLCVGPIIAILVRSFGRRMRSASLQSMSAMRDISKVIEESVAAHKVIKIYDGQMRQSVRFKLTTEAFRRAQMREAIPATATTPVTHIAASLAIAFIAYLALSRTTGSASSSPGGFVSFITAMLLLIAPLKQLTTVKTNLQKGMAAAENIFQFLDMKEETDTGQVELTQARGAIKFTNVKLTYPGSTKAALNSVSFEVPPGHTVALVGPSGGGKSTIGNLIPRFINIDEGSISIDGVDITDITLTSLRRNIAYVSQDIVLLDDTIAANIAFGESEKVSVGQIIAAAKAANAWEFIQNLPQGLASPIGNNGIKLSGGQRQRIAIARALLKNAPILILDEATSALDTESEERVQEALDKLMVNRTTLIIAHRLSSVAKADKIMVLSAGSILESGRHTDLVKQNGVYAKLAKNSFSETQTP